MHLPDLIATIPPELRDYIRDLEERAAASSTYQGQVAKLEQRVAFLEDQFRLAQLKRFAPSSEKTSGQGSLFNEAEQAAAAFPEEDEFDDMPDRQPTTLVSSGCKLIQGGCCVILGLVYAENPRLFRYSTGLSEPRDILMRFSLYQWM